MTTKDGDAFREMQARLADLLPRLNERDRRAAMATEAKSWGRGGISAVQRATGASRSTIQRVVWPTWPVTFLKGPVIESERPEGAEEGRSHQSCIARCAEYLD